MHTLHGAAVWKSLGESGPSVISRSRFHSGVKRKKNHIPGSASPAVPEKSVSQLSAILASALRAILCQVGPVLVTGPPKQPLIEMQTYQSRLVIA